MTLNAERIGSWRRMDGSESPSYVMSYDSIVEDSDELLAAIEAGMQISIYGGKSGGVTSLSFLDPVIEEIRDLYIGTINRITDVQVLNKARNLRSLTFATGPCDGVMKLAELPFLEELEISVSRVVASALLNPNVKYLTVYGAMPKSFVRVRGPVEVFVQEGGRAQEDLPIFEQPAAMRSIWRAGPRRFDLGQLAEMWELRELTLGACPDVVGIGALAELSNLEFAAFKECGTSERWEDLPDIPRAMLFEVSPIPDTDFIQRKKAVGWILPLIDPNDEREQIFVDEDEDEGSFGVFMDRFDALSAAVELYDDSTPSGIHGELFLQGVIAELRAQGVKLDPEADSEGGFTALYFPERSQAEQVADRAREVLEEANPGELAAYLRRGALAP
ncbi:hypothetical protein ACUOFU_08465 [Microbacterium arabinogalactanolyticum]|uniref:hypothetical protein n=1 Tax=Microbacterium arabinogalactanolyticum TaxID=69365 RepID=UPI0040439535